MDLLPALSESTEEYLEAIFKLGGAEKQPASVRDLASTLGLSRPSVSQMLTRLAAEGLVVRGRAGAVTMTRDGAQRAARLVRRHRLSERFLADYLDLPWDQVHDEACKFEHVLSDEVEERLARQLGEPETCPHGHAIPSPDGIVRPSAARPLLEAPHGRHVTIAHISDERADLLRYLASLGLLPQTDIVVEEQAPFGGPLLVRVGDSQYALGREVAETIFVES